VKAAAVEQVDLPLSERATRFVWHKRRALTPLGSAPSVAKGLC
jgi:hypothetical protein